MSEPTSPVSCLPPAHVRSTVIDAMSAWLAAMYVIVASLTVCWVGVSGSGVGVGLVSVGLRTPEYTMPAAAITIIITATATTKIGFFILFAPM